MLTKHEKAAIIGYWRNGATIKEIVSYSYFSVKEIKSVLQHKAIKEQ